MFSLRSEEATERVLGKEARMACQATKYWWWWFLVWRLSKETCVTLIDLLFISHVFFSQLARRCLETSFSNTIHPLRYEHQPPGLARGCSCTTCPTTWWKWCSSTSTKSSCRWKWWCTNTSTSWLQWWKWCNRTSTKFGTSCTSSPSWNWWWSWGWCTSELRSECKCY